MQEFTDRETRREQTQTDSQSVVQALRSDDPDIRAGGFNAALRLLFRLNGLTRQTQQHLDRERALIDLPVAEALQSVDLWTRSRAGGAMNELLATLQEAVRKKQRVEQMIEQLREEIRVARRAEQARLVRACLLGLGALTLIYIQGSHAFMFWWLVFPLSGSWAMNKSREHAMIQKLSEAWDPRAVGVLAVAVQDVTLRNQALPVLISLLPRVRASDAAFIDAEGMAALVALLKVEDDPLLLALLQALEQIGDARAVPGVLALRDSPRVHPAIRQAAAECLPSLENRVRLSRESATLLRPSSGLNSADAAAVLLRPASDAVASPDNLLRPADKEPAVPSAQAETADPPLFSVRLPTEPVSHDTTGHSNTSLS